MTTVATTARKKGSPSSTTAAKSRSVVLLLVMTVVVFFAGWNLRKLSQFVLAWNLASSSSIPSEEEEKPHAVAGLSCQAYGGPSDELAAEMVYWRDIPSDAEWVSPLKGNEEEEEKFLTFEPDEGGWNNIRMGMETVVMMALAMGRTLVMPPAARMYLLNGKPTVEFADFFHFESVQTEHVKALKVITMEEFLEKFALKGKMRDTRTREVTYPPGMRTDWNGYGNNWDSAKRGDGGLLWQWLRNSSLPLSWNHGECVAAFPSEPGSDAANRMNQYLDQVRQSDRQKYPQADFRQAWRQRLKSYDRHPTPVDAPPAERLAELLADRQKLCVYNDRFQQAPVVHSFGEQKSGYRLLVHFYAFLFFEDWHQDLWTKRFVRDHLRYVDEVQCAAARVVAQIRALSRSRGDERGSFDSMHVRHGDFQYEHMKLSAEDHYQYNVRGVIRENRTVFVATDEKDKSFFKVLREHYEVVFLDDFKVEILGMNSIYYGMLDQLIASRGDAFVGTYLSTFTGYINRMRGYHSQKVQAPSYRDGVLASYYSVPNNMAEWRRVHRKYTAVSQGFWQQEFPVGWRDLDHDVDPEQILSR